MHKSKSWMCLWVAVSITFFPAAHAYSQESAMPGAGVNKEITAISEKTLYVKPGNVTVNFKNADIRAVLRYLSEVSDVDIVPSPDVTGSVTLSLTDKPWEVALEIIVKNYGYAYEREGNIIRVVTIASLKLEELSTEVMPLNYATAENAQESIRDMLTERGKLTYDQRINALVVTDLATNIYKIKKVVLDLDKKTPQVMIEAKIFETTLSTAEKMGIDWDFVISVAGARRPTTLPWANWGDQELFMPRALERFYPMEQEATETVGTLTAAGAFGADAVTTTATADFPIDRAHPVGFPFIDTGAFAFGALDFTEFKAVLELLKQRSNTEILSSPRITTLNHEEAKILVGQVFNFPIFELSEETSRWTIIGYEQKDLGVKLEVIPHINTKNEIVVELKPELSQFQGMQEISAELKAPLWSTREAETQVMVKDGDTIFIGGLIKETEIETEDKLPLLGDLFGDIPIIGSLVKSKGTGIKKTELIFFITVHIIKDMESLKQLAIRDISGIKLPGNMLRGREADQGRAPKKEHRPLFDLRKKKKK